MPANTAVPSACLSSAPAPVAQTSGITPKMKASDVIRIGRNRRRAASIAAAKVARFYYYPGWWEGGTTLHLLINLAKWNELPKSYQAIVGAAAGFANVEMQARYDARNPHALKRLIAAGTQLRPFSPSVMEACWKASIEVNNETSAVNADYKKVWESIEAFRNDEYFWWQVAEYSSDTFMIRNMRRT